MSEQLLPLPPEGVKLPVQPPPDPAPLKLDTAGIEAAAKRLGMWTMKADKLAACYSLGKAIKEVGALKIGRTILLAAAANSQESIDKCDEIIDRTTDDALALTALQVKRQYVKSQADVGSKFIESVEVDGSDDAGKQGKVRPFEPGMQAGPVVIAQQAVVNTQPNNH